MKISGFSPHFFSHARDLASEWFTFLWCASGRWFTHVRAELPWVFLVSMCVEVLGQDRAGNFGYSI